MGGERAGADGLDVSVEDADADVEHLERAVEAAQVGGDCGGAPGRVGGRVGGGVGEAARQARAREGWVAGLRTLAGGAVGPLRLHFRDVVHRDALRLLRLRRGGVRERCSGEN